MSSQPRHFPDLIEAYLQFTSNHEATPKIHLWSFLSCLAATLERKVWLNRGYYTLFPNLYVFIIGRSGLVKKSTSTAIAVNLIREIPTIQIMSERLTASSLIRQISQTQTSFQYGEGEKKQAAIFAYASELAVFLEEVFGSIAELLTTFYDCAPHDDSKPWVYRTVKDGETKIYGPCLNILGASTKTWLRKAIPNSEMEGGFSSRVIFVVENQLPERLVAWPTLPVGLQEMRLALIQDLQVIHDLKGSFEVEESAKKLFTEWYEYHHRKVLPLNSDPRMVGYMGRKGDHILKLAMIRSVTLSNSLVITSNHITWASSKLEELERDMRDAFDSGYSQGLDDLPFEIKSYVKKREKIKASEIVKIFGVTFPGTEIQAAVQTLVGMGEVVEVMVDEDNTPTKYLTYPGSGFNLL